MKTCKTCNLEKSLGEFYKHRNSCKNCVKEQNKKWKENNKDKIKETKRKWEEDNKEYRKKYKREYMKKRKINDSSFKLKTDISRLIRMSLLRNGYKKLSRTNEILGCTYEELKEHLESKFEDWMTWDNKGLYNGEERYGWDVDHITPIASAESEEDIIKLNHYTNLQPLCSYYNRVIKKDGLIEPIFLDKDL